MEKNLRWEEKIYFNDFVFARKTFSFPRKMFAFSRNFVLTHKRTQTFCAKTQRH